MIREITPVSGTFISPIMSEACGVEVTITFAGSVRNKKFPDRPHGPTDMEFGHVKWIATAGDNEVHFEDVSTNVTRVDHDGTMTSQIAGHRPVEVTGVVKTNLDTGQTILESQVDGKHIPDLCRRLAG